MASFSRYRVNQAKLWQWRYPLGCISVFLILLFILAPKHHTAYGRLNPLKTHSNPLPRERAANSTLGFQTLLALSTGPSWRTRGLNAAAGLTDLDFTIPPQPQNPEELVLAFERIGAGSAATTPQHGSAKAWLAHLDMLKFVIASEFETALIVEDDVDWDVRIKHQIRLISDIVRNYTGVSSADPTPYGTEWDVLWLGHCGSAIEDWMPPGQVFLDDTRCKTELYSGWSKHFLRDKLAESHRLLQVSVQTVCTFGYAVTRASAQKILGLLARGGNEAFDVALSSYCRSGALRCLVVNPQIMNHYEPATERGYLSPVHVGDGQGKAADDSQFEFVKGTTGNIMKSARCQVLFNDVCMRSPSEI